MSCGKRPATGALARLRFVRLDGVDFADAAELASLLAWLARLCLSVGWLGKLEWRRSLLSVEGAVALAQSDVA